MYATNFRKLGSFKKIPFYVLELFLSFGVSHTSTAFRNEVCSLSSVAEAPQNFGNWIFTRAQVEEATAELDRTETAVLRL
jgi:hypothetical protein